MGQGSWQVPARPLLLWVTVLSPAHGYPSATPNPSWASAAPRGTLWIQGAQRVERGRGVAQAAVQELWCHPHLRAHPVAPAFALRGIRDTATVGQEGLTLPGSLALNMRCCLIPGTGAHPGLQGQQRGGGAVLGLELRLCHPFAQLWDVGLAAGSGHRAVPWPHQHLLLHSHCSPLLQYQREAPLEFSRFGRRGLSLQGSCLLPGARQLP